jgi:hypothetical protein
MRTFNQIQLRKQFEKFTDKEIFLLLAVVILMIIERYPSKEDFDFLMSWIKTNGAKAYRFHNKFLLKKKANNSKSKQEK